MVHDAVRKWPRVLALVSGLGSLTPGLPALGGDEPAVQAPTPTYAKDVAPILRARCQGCHRPGQVGPFALETYEQARKRAADIAALTADRSMPPWKPAPGVGPPLAHDPSLTEAEISTLAAWADAGAPEGDPAQLGPAPRFEDSWKLGPPDLVLESSEDFALPATGPDIYRCFVLPTNLPEDVYLEAVDYRPGAPSVVHHLVSYVDTSGMARRLAEAEPGPGYTSSTGGGQVGADELGFWAAGGQPRRLPEGVGIRLPKGSDVILQVHYHPSGKPVVDRTKVGLYFSKGPVKQAVHWNNAANYAFRLPAGNPDISVEAEWFVPVAVDLLALSPHMHTLGRRMTMSVAYPDGRKQDLIRIDDWDPSWQQAYYLEQPMTLPAGSTIHVRAVFDNSDHSRNPNHPPRHVGYGQNTDDEMCIGYVAVVKHGQDLTRPRAHDDLYEIFYKQRLRQQQRHQSKRNR